MESPASGRGVDRDLKTLVITMKQATRRNRGFTLVELAIAVVIIGVLAAFGVPRYLAAVERTKAAEAFQFLRTVASAQERYHARNSQYCRVLEELDIELSEPEYFKAGQIRVPSSAKNFQTGWELKLTRQGASGGYGKYTVIYSHLGYDPQKSTIPDEITPAQTK